jgi:Skp family chaperone for outer membrane proteins
MYRLLLATLLVILATTASANDAGLPLAKRVSMEKVLLVEQYQKGMEKCREEKRKTVKEKCQARRKADLDKEMDVLLDNPKAYFHNKERQGQVAQPGKID